MLLLQVREQEGDRSVPCMRQRGCFRACAVCLTKVHEREIQMFKMTKGNNNGKNLCKGDMEHINSQCKFKHSFYILPQKKSATQLHTIYLSKFTIKITEKCKKKKKNQRKNKNEIWYIQNKFFIELRKVQFSCPRFDFHDQQQRRHEKADCYRQN